MAPGLSYGRSHARDLGKLRRIGDELVDAGFDRRIVNSCISFDDDTGAVAGLAGESLIQEIDCFLGFGPWDLEGIDKRSASGGNEPDDEDDRDQPATEHSPVMPGCVSRPSC